MSSSIVRKLAAVTLAAGLTVGSSGSFAGVDADAREQAVTQAFEQVDSIPMLTRPYSWQAIDDKTVILWATPFDPYLVELKFASHDLKWAHAIGVTQFGSRVYAKFDAVKVRGFRYP